MAGQDAIKSVFFCISGMRLIYNQRYQISTQNVIKRELMAALTVLRERSRRQQTTDRWDEDRQRQHASVGSRDCTQTLQAIQYTATPTSTKQEHQKLWQNHHIVLTFLGDRHVRPMLSDRCLSCVSVALVYCGQRARRIRMPLSMEVGLVSCQC